MRADQGSFPPYISGYFLFFLSINAYELATMTKIMSTIMTNHVQKLPPPCGTAALAAATCEFSVVLEATACPFTEVTGARLADAPDGDADAAGETTADVTVKAEPVPESAI